MKEDMKAAVRSYYAARAAGKGCCAERAAAAPRSPAPGYGIEELSSLPDGTDLGLGCGNPLSAADVRPGETILDLGSGAGIDCFLAARIAGPEGRVIGVDMTPEMIERARRAAARQAEAAAAERSGFAPVEFRLGDIEHLPVADQTVDVIISNCVVNLALDKAAVFSEAFRVLKPGGRLCISDIIAEQQMPREAAEDPELYAACVSGAIPAAEYRAALTIAGFTRVAIEPKREHADAPCCGVGQDVPATYSAYIVAWRPEGQQELHPQESGV